MTVVRAALRFLFVLGLSLTALAVGVARLVSAPAERSSRPVRRARVQYEGVNDQTASGAEHGCRLLDASTGRIVSMKLPDNDMLLFARSSPWEGSDGQVQVVGRWLARSAKPRGLGFGEVGLARCTFPGGEVLDRIPVDVVPLSPPCWFPGPEPRILYGGTDGQLYQFAFDDPAAEESDSDPRARPVPVRWACQKPGHGEVRISDPTWPTDSRLGGRVVASLTYIEGVGAAARFVPSQLWWLELTGDGGAIKAAGRLMIDRHRGPSSACERFPSLAATPDGGLALAYLASPEGQVGWDMRLAPVSIDPNTGEPRSRSRASVLVARDVAVASPTFSSDGRWLHGLPSTARAPLPAERFGVGEVLAARHERQLAGRGDPARPGRRAHAVDGHRPPRGERLHGKS
jgi:hypothetical protein